MVFYTLYYIANIKSPATENTLKLLTLNIKLIAVCDIKLIPIAIYAGSATHGDIARRYKTATFPILQTTDEYYLGLDGIAGWLTGLQAMHSKLVDKSKIPLPPLAKENVALVAQREALKMDEDTVSADAPKKADEIRQILDEEMARRTQGLAPQTAAQIKASAGLSSATQPPKMNPTLEKDFDIIKSMSSSMPTNIGSDTMTY